MFILMSFLYSHIHLYTYIGGMTEKFLHSEPLTRLQEWTIDIYTYTYSYIRIYLSI
jgi:hypothetical protein